MAWLELKIDTLPTGIEAAAAALTAELRQSIPDPHERGKVLREKLRELL